MGRKLTKAEHLIILRGNSLMWQWAPSKPGWHLHMYSVKTSPRLDGAMTSHTPSFLQGLGLQGPGRMKEKLRSSSIDHVLNPCFWPYLSLSGCRCLLQSRRHRYRWRGRLLPRSHMFLHCDKYSPHSSHLSGKSIQLLKSPLPRLNQANSPHILTHFVVQLWCI